MGGAALLALAFALADTPQTDVLPAIVHFADGSSLPLADWTLSYEYLAWPKGRSPSFGESQRTESRELWIGGDRVPATGLTMALVYGKGEGAPLVRLVLTAKDGKHRKRTPEPPTRERLAAAEDMLLLPRSLDFFGQTLMGTRRELCLVSFSVLVHCGADPANRVVKIEFP